MKGLKGFQKGHKINVGRKVTVSEEVKNKIKQTLIRKGIRPPSSKGRITSEETKKKLSEALKGYKRSPEEIEKSASKRRGKPNLKLRGENNSMWKGGITPKYHKIRTSIEYTQWRTAVFRRDNYTCVWCGIKNGNGKSVILQADHIKQFAYFPELRFELSNGRTLCIDCHKKTDTHSKKY